ncbi:YadA-like family protein [Megamonas sp.]
MAKNKKAQILAAVMCAATVAGVSPAISSAATVESGTIAESSKDGNNLAIGVNSEIGGNTTNSIAIGEGWVPANRTDSIAINGETHGSHSITVGTQSYIFNADYSLALGYGAKVGKSGPEGTELGIVNSVSIGRNSQVIASNAVAFGAYANVGEGADNAVAIGANSNVAEGSEGAIAIGNNASVQAGLNNSKESIVLGTNSIVSANGAVVLGSNSNSSGENSVVLGPWAKASGYNSVALGFGSEATENEVVSVGNENNQRRIVNVADGINETDAATVGQMNAATEGTVKWDKDTDGNYQEGILKGVKLSEGTVTAKDITTDTINVAEGQFIVDEDGISAADGKFTVNDLGEVTAKAGFDGNSIFSLTENGVEMQSGNTAFKVTSGGVEVRGINGLSTYINGNEINTGTVLANEMYIGSKADENAVATIGDINTTVGEATENTKGIERVDSDNDGKLDTTVIEDNTSISKDGLETSGSLVSENASGKTEINGGKLTVTGPNGGSTTISGDSISTGHIVTDSITTGSITIGDPTQGGIHLGDTGALSGNIKDEDSDFTYSNTADGYTSVAKDNNGNKAQTSVGADSISNAVSDINGNRAETNLTKDGFAVTTNTMNEQGELTSSTATITGSDVVINSNTDNEIKLSDMGQVSNLNKELKENSDGTLVGAINAESAMRQQLSGRVDGLESRVGSLEDRMGDVEDRIDKVGAMAAAIANLRTMGYDPEAPTEIAVGVGQYESETGLALGVFHYPNQDFMLSASISTSGDEVMGGIGATWKIGRKSSAEKARSVEEKRVAKAEEMQEMAKAEKVKAQRERHAQMLAEREAAK